MRYRRYPTRVLCADPQHSVFFDFYRSAVAGASTFGLSLERGSCIEGIGRPRVEASFIPGCIDAMLKVPDALSLAAMRWVSAQLGRRVGGSTGTNFIGVLEVAQRLHVAGERGSIVTILCDSGERYAHSYYNPHWYVEQGIDTVQADATLQAALGEGQPQERKRLADQVDDDGIDRATPLTIAVRMTVAGDKPGEERDIGKDAMGQEGAIAEDCRQQGPDDRVVGQGAEGRRRGGLQPGTAFGPVRQAALRRRVAGAGARRHHRRHACRGLPLLARDRTTRRGTAARRAAQPAARAAAGRLPRLNYPRFILTGAPHEEIH